MDAPVYKLEHVVHSREGMEDFEGPLDLILYLLGKNRIEIQDIPIALILEQYLAYLELRQQMLLSPEHEEAQSEMEELIRSLEERRSTENYARIKHVSAILGPMGEFGRDILCRGPEPMEQGRLYEYSHRPSDLLEALGEIASREERRLPPPLSNFDEIVRQEPYPVAGKAAEIMDRLRRGITSFRLLFRGSRSRSEVVATFLAVLELCRARMIHLAGGESECTVTPTGETADALPL